MLEGKKTRRLGFYGMLVFDKQLRSISDSLHSIKFGEDWSNSKEITKVFRNATAILNSDEFAFLI